MNFFFNEWKVFVGHLLCTGSGTRIQKWTEKNLCPPEADILVEKDNSWNSKWLSVCVWHGHFKCGPQVTANPLCVTRCPQIRSWQHQVAQIRHQASSLVLLFCFLARHSRWRMQRVEAYIPAQTSLLMMNLKQFLNWLLQVALGWELLSAVNKTKGRAGVVLLKRVVGEDCAE